MSKRPKYLTVKAAASKMGVSPQRVYQLIEEGRIKPINAAEATEGLIDSDHVLKYLLKEEDVDSLMTQMRDNPIPPGPRPKVLLSV